MPKKPKREKVIRPLTVHLTGEQYERLLRAAISSGISMSSKVRRMIDGIDLRKVASL